MGVAKKISEKTKRKYEIKRKRRKNIAKEESIKSIYKRALNSSRVKQKGEIIKSMRDQEVKREI